MAYDQDLIPKDLHPLNIMRIVPDDPMISPATSSGRPVEMYYTSPPTNGSPDAMPAVYYPVTVPPVAYNNVVTGVAGWIQQIVPPFQVQEGVVSGTVVNPLGVYTTSPNYGTRNGCSPSDHTSDEGGDSLLGRKVKFLCSFGGKILPRLSDGALRYVGGQTRIISVGKDVLFSEFVQKMADMYVHNLVIKYQLPGEDLDALVTVSCADDIENMMDEYEKLIERSTDGSIKLRIFLFSSSDLECVGHIGDIQDGGQKYVEAVNEIGDVFSGGGCIVRKESIESTISAQNSDLSCIEGGDSLSHGLEEIVSVSSTSALSLNGNVVPFDTTSRVVHVDPNPLPYADSCAASLSIPVVKTSPTITLSAITEQEVERYVPLSVSHRSTIMSYPTSSSYMQAYADPHLETLSHANYVQQSPQMGFPTQILGTVRSVFTQQPMVAGASPQQFTPTAHMKMNPSFIGMRPNVVPVVGQPQHVQVENYPAESMMSLRLVHLPVTQGYNVNQTQVSATTQGGMYNWQQIPYPEQMALFEGGLSPQSIVFSDTIAQEQKGSPPCTPSDARSIYTSLMLDGRGRPLIRPIEIGTWAEGNMEQPAEFGKVHTEAIGVSQNVEGQNIYDRTNLHKVELSKVTIPQGVVSEVQFSYGVFMDNIPPSSQASAVQNLVVQPQFQILPETTYSKPLSNDFAPIGMNLQKDHVGRESPKEYSPKVSTKCPTDDSTSAVGANHLPPDDVVGNSVYSIERILSINEWNDNVLWSQPRISGDKDVANEGSFVPPFHGVGNILDNLASQFIDENPWMHLDTHYPPPRPTEIQIKRDNVGLRDLNSGETPRSNSRDLVLETPLDDAAYQLSNNLNWDLSPNLNLSNKGLADEQIKRELQAVVEGVAASVFHSSIHLNPESSVYMKSESPPISQQNRDDQLANVETEQREKFDEIKIKLSGKINLRFPTSGIGRLQIIKNNYLEELRELGSGTFGTVYHGKWRGTDVAIKRINDRCFSEKPSEQERMRDDFWNEAIKLTDLHHPNVVAFYGVVLDGPDGSIATVTEYMVNGSLRNVLQRNDRILDKRKRILISMDVAFGMEYLHGKNIVHFDLKSDNLLVNLRDPHRPICKVGDLGLSKVKCQTLISGGVRGTLPWMTPELLNGSSSLVSEKVDVFSFGIVMWELLTGEEPYGDLHYGTIIGGIVSNTLRPPVPESCDPDWRALMERCWSSEPPERPNFTKIADELRAMANKLPSKGQLHQPKS